MLVGGARAYSSASLWYFGNHSKRYFTADDVVVAWSSSCRDFKPYAVGHVTPYRPYHHWFRNLSDALVWGYWYPSIWSRSWKHCCISDMALWLRLCDFNVNARLHMLVSVLGCAFLNTFSLSASISQCIFSASAYWLDLAVKGVTKALAEQVVWWASGTKVNMHVSTRI
jgi:hypothetical protein